MGKNQTQVDGRMTEEQKTFATNILNGVPLYDAYVSAYMDGSTPERTAGNYTKKQIQNRASQMKNSKGVRVLLEQGLIQQDIQNAGKAVWDRRKATNALMKAQERAEDYLDKLEDATHSLQNTGKDYYRVYEFGVTMLAKATDTMLKIAQELNKMYGLAVPEVVNQNAVQVIFGAMDTLPKDKDLEGFEED